MNKILAVLVLNSLCAVSALSAPDKCSMNTRNSCWTFANQGSGQLSISCRDDHGYFKGQRWDISPGKTLAVQFSMAWGDGLGFPEPGVHIQCDALSSETNTGAHLKFTTIGWGDAVTMAATNGEVVVTQQDGWDPSRQMVSRFPL
jgi:hypothetical protein